jgi:hypothetical protein
MTIANIHPGSGTETVTISTGPKPRRRPATRAESVHVIAVIYLDAGITLAEVRRLSATWAFLAELGDEMERILTVRPACETVTRHVPCGLDACSAQAGTPCTPDGSLHMIRLAEARRQRIITPSQMAAALGSAVAFPDQTLVSPDGDLAIAADDAPRFTPGAPSPCCGDDGERLFRSPWTPGWLVCSNDGQKFPARPELPEAGAK